MIHYIYNIDSYFTCNFENNLVNGKLLGVFTQITSSTISSSIYGQIILVDCSDITISNQEISNTSNSISIYSSNNIYMTKNICTNNSENGIYVFDSYYITLFENICINNTNDGIYVKESIEVFPITNECRYNTNGITLYNSSSSIIFNNTCSNNRNYGIYLTGEFDHEFALSAYDIKLQTTSDLNLIVYNTLVENEGYGIYLEYSNNNLIYNNTFINNNLGGSSQAYDAGSGNTWYNAATQEGNYYNDWPGTGTYSIDGSAGSIDLYPLVEIPNPPSIPPISEYSYNKLILIIAIIPLIMIGFVLLKRKKI